MAEDRGEQPRDESRLARLEALIRSSADAIVGETLDGIVTDWNPAAERLYGYSAAEMVGRPLHLLISPDRTQEADALLARARRGESIEGIETVRWTKSGRRIDVSLTVSPVRNDAGQIIGTSAIVRDITARVRLEQQLRASETQFANAFEHAAIGMALVRLDGRWLKVNRALCELTGYSEEELLARTFQDITHPDDIASDLAQAAGLLTGKIRSYQMEKRYVCRDGTIVWVLLSGSLVRDDAGLPLHFIAQVQDISDRKTAGAERTATHQNTRDVLERITDGFYALDRDWRFTYVNEAAERMLGRTRDALLGTNLWEAFPPTIETPLYAAYHEALATGVSVTFEFYYPPSEHWIEGRAFPAPDGLSVFFRDVTARRQRAEELRASEEKYRTLVDHLPAVIYQLAADKAQTRLYFSPRHEALTGFPVAETLANTGHWLDLVHPDDRARVEAENDRAEASGEQFRAEYRLARQDGSYVWVLDECVPVRDDSGQIVAWQGVLLDISGRVQAEAALRESEARFRAVWDTTADAMALSDPDGIVLAANPAYRELYGLPPEAIVGQSFAVIFPEAAREAARAGYQAIFANPDPSLSYTSTVQRADGTRREVEARATFIVDNGERQAMISSIRDVTERVRLEAQLRASEEKFRSLVDQLPALVYVLAADENQTPLYFSPHLEELTGYRPEEAMARADHWLDQVHPDDRARVAAADARATASGAPLRIEYRYRRKDGSYIWILDDSVALRDETGAVVAIQGVLLDVSERVAAEEERAQLAAIVESAEDGILSTTLDGTITSWNRGAERLYGYLADEVIGQSVMLLRAPEQPDDITGMVERAWRGEPVEGHQTVRRTKDGRVIDVSLATSPVLDASGKVVAVSSVSRDITELRRAEGTLRLRDRALAATTNGIIITDPTLPDNPIVDVNPAFESLTGYVRAEVVGHSARMLYGADTDPAATLRIREAILAGRDITETVLTYRKDGTPFWTHHNVAAVRDDAGNLTHFVGVLTDVTERVEAEAALARERDLLQTLLEHLPDAVYVKDTASRFLRLNQATAQQLGITDPAEAIGKTDRDFFAETLAGEYLSDERRLFESGEPMLNRSERQTVGGDGRWVLATKVPLRVHDGTVIGLVGINRDITEMRRQQEEMERLAAIVESSNDAIISSTPEGIITSWNLGAERLYGFTAEQMIGRSFTVLLPENQEPIYLGKVDATGERAGLLESRRRRRDGTLIDVSVAYFPILDDTGATIGVSTIARDITERKRLERDLRAALDGAKAATRTKSQFLAMMSHELRTPLQAVLGYADLLLLGPEGSLSDEQVEDIGYIHGGATRMMTLIGQLLDLSRMEAGRLKLAEVPVDLIEILEQVRQDVAPQVGAKGIDLRIDLPPSLPLVIGDPDRLRQILLNLVGNAVKFTDEGAVCITACTSDDGVDVDVSDTGIGITEDAMPHIFEEFRQVDGNLTRRYGGAGLGLAIAYKLAKQMGGSIDVVSQYGTGSTFTLHLPAVATARSGRRAD